MSVLPIRSGSTGVAPCANLYFVSWVIIICPLSAYLSVVNTCYMQANIVCTIHSTEIRLYFIQNRNLQKPAVEASAKIIDIVPTIPLLRGEWCLCTCRLLPCELRIVFG